MTKRAYVCSNGCPENLMDSGRVHKYLVQNGWHVGDSPEKADLILFNTCGLTETNEKDSLVRIEDLQARSKDGSRLLVWGCLPKIHPEALQAICKGPYLGEKALLSQIDSLIEAEFPIASITNNEIYPTDSTATVSTSTINGFLKRRFFPEYLEAQQQLDLYRPEDPSIYYMKICSGCLGRCAYCAVRLSRGAVKSKSLKTVVGEFKAGLAAGYREFSLMGTDIGCYGYDRGYTLCDLLEKMIIEEGCYKIGIRNMNPAFTKRLINRLEPILKTGKIWFLGFPAESGSNRILKLMGRNYTVDQYREHFLRLKDSWPELAIRNQMLVGFPTETEQDFEASLNLLGELEIDYNEIYAFSGRPGTAAYELEGQVPSPIIKLRYHRMLSRILWQHRTKTRGSLKARGKAELGKTDDVSCSGKAVAKF